MKRSSVLKVVDEHVKTDSLRKHLLAVETCMKSFDRQLSDDEELWGMAELVHDFDWDVCPTPDGHPAYGAAILRERGFSEVIVNAVLSQGNHTGVKRESLMEKTLFPCDEIYLDSSQPSPWLGLPRACPTPGTAQSNTK